MFEGMAAVAFPDLNGDGYTDVVTIADYRDESSRILSEVRIFIYHAGGYFLEEVYLEDAYNISHEEKTIAGIEEFVSRPENQDYFAGTSIYGRWRVEGYHLGFTLCPSRRLTAMRMQDWNMGPHQCGPMLTERQTPSQGMSGRLLLRGSWKKISGLMAPLWESRGMRWFLIG